MGAPLNVFKTYTADLTDSIATIYTAPEGHTTVVLLAQVSNISDSTVRVFGSHVRNGKSTSLVYNGSIPVYDTINLLSGKLVLETGDSISANASVSGSAQILLSILETLNP